MTELARCLKTLHELIDHQLKQVDEMQGKHKVAPAPRESNVALVILQELQTHHSSQSAEPSKHSIVSARYVKPEDKCCVVQ